MQKTFFDFWIWYHDILNEYFHSTDKTNMWHKMIKIKRACSSVSPCVTDPPQGSAGAAAVRPEQSGRGLRPAGPLCSGLGGHTTGSTGADRHGFHHPAAVSGCWRPGSARHRSHRPQPGRGPGAQPALHQRGWQDLRWRQRPEVGGHQRGRTDALALHVPLCSTAAHCARPCTLYTLYMHASDMEPHRFRLRIWECPLWHRRPRSTRYVVVRVM